MEQITREAVVELLNVAACPAYCNNGVIVRDAFHGEIEQCQFCYEREQAIASLQSAEPVAEVIHNFVGVDIAWCVPPSSGRPPVGTKLFTLPISSTKAQSVVVPNEHGKNRYGLDMSYFRNLFNRELNRPLVDFRPDELARVLARASRAADDSVMQEAEFQPAKAQVPDAVIENLARQYGCHTSDGFKGFALAVIEKHEEAMLTASPAPEHIADAGRMVGWISVDERLPEPGITVMVYAPPQPGDYADEVRIGFDCICPDSDGDYWLDHGERYEHYSMVAKGGVGPSAKAPYTHWMPLPKAPQPEEAEPVVQHRYPCGCVTCICEDDEQCQGCGATTCADYKGPTCGCNQQEEAER